MSSCEEYGVEHQWVPLVHLTANRWLVLEGKIGSPPTFPWQCRDCERVMRWSAEELIERGLVAVASLNAPLV